MGGGCLQFHSGIIGHAEGAHQSSGDADARLEPDGFDIEATDSVDDAKPGADCPVGIVLMRLRVAEIDQHSAVRPERQRERRKGSRCSPR